MFISGIKRNENGISIEKDVNIHLENQKVSRYFFWFLWLIYVVVTMSKNCYNAALANIVSDGVLTKSQTGIISAMFYVLYTPLQIPGGMFADRFSPERLLKFGLIGAALVNTVIFFNQNYYVMLIAWMFNGAIQFGIWPSIFKIISSQLVRSDRQQMTFYISFTTSAGLFIAYFIAAVVPNWEYLFAISAVTLLVFAILLHIYEKVVNPYMKWDTIKPPLKSKEKEKDTNNISIFKIFRASGFFIVLLSTIFAVLVSQSRATLSSVMFVENYEAVSASLGNMFNTILIIAGLIGTIIAKKFISKIKNEIVALVVFTTTMIPLFCVALFINSISIAVLISVFALIATIESIVNILRNNYTIYFSKYSKSGTAAGIINAGLSFSYMVAFYVMPRIVEIWGWRSLIEVWIGLIILSVISLFWAVRRFKNFLEMFF